MTRMKIALTLLLPLLFPANLPATIGRLAGESIATVIDPSITVSDVVGGTIYTSGQTRTVNITWNAGSDYDHSEIYYTVNDVNQTELGRGRAGTKPLIVTAGNAYHLWMVVYPGGGQFKVVTEARFVAAQMIEPVLPPPAPASSDGAGFSDGVSDRGAVATVYRVPINNVRVERGARHFMIRFNGQPNEMPYVAIGRGPAIIRNNELVFGDNLVGGGVVGIGTVSNAEKAKGQYMFASAFGNSFSEDALEPGRTYHYIITVPAPGGKRTQKTGEFSMLREITTVKVIWDRLLVLDDSDDFSTAELQFWLWTNYGQPSGKVSRYYNGDADTGRGYNLSKTVVIENAPRVLTLSASGIDSDGSFSRDLSDDEPPLSGPSNESDDHNVAKGEFDLEQSPGLNVSVPFALNAMPGGALNFTVFGRLEINRTTSENIGTSSSALTTGAGPEAVRPQGRIKLPGSAPSTLTKCEAAKQARARNSPAAPGLEAQCRDEGAVKPVGRIKQPDGTTTRSTLTKCEAAKQARARNSPAAPGLEAQCLAEQKR